MNNVNEGSCIALCYISLDLDLKIQKYKWQYRYSWAIIYEGSELGSWWWWWWWSIKRYKIASGGPRYALSNCPETWDFGGGSPEVQGDPAPPKIECLGGQDLSCISLLANRSRTWSLSRVLLSLLMCYWIKNDWHMQTWYLSKAPQAVLVFQIWVKFLMGKTLSV